MRTLQGQYFNHVRWRHTSEPYENKMQLKFLACLTEKFNSGYSLCAKWVKSCPHSVNIKHNMKRSFLSILDRMQGAKKPSHATVPLNAEQTKSEWHRWSTCSYNKWVLSNSISLSKKKLFSLRLFCTVIQNLINYCIIAL